MFHRSFAVHSLAALVLLAAGGCASHRQETTHAKESGPHTTHWSYSGATGPAYWGSLSPEYALCSNGRSQSPIDIAAAAPRDLPNITFNYQPSPMSIINNGHTVQVNYAPGSYIILDGERFDLAQFHFHAPSEHTIKGAHAAAEMHLVHKSASGGLAVVGVMLREGAPNTNFEPIAANMPDSGQTVQKPEIMVNAAGLLPADARTYRYAGSLTTPPGTEGVKWNLMLEPVTVSSSQLAAFRRRYDANNRPIQKLNGREIIEDTTR
jgi:carbonic anhydrase